MNTISVNKYNKNHKKVCYSPMCSIIYVDVISDRVKAPAFVVKCLFLS